MRKIHGDVFSYAEFPKHQQVLKEGTDRQSFGVRSQKGGPTWTTVQNVREWPGFTVRSFEELVKIGAHLAAGNRGHMLFFRGQGHDHVDRNGRSNLYPTLYRKGGSPLRKEELADRWARLQVAMHAIIKNKKELALPGKTHRHIEAAIALLQHYRLCETPLLDVTPSLRVAASFALPDKKATRGYLYAIALPYPHGTISHFVDQDTVLVRLFGVCPFDAVRPHFQEGYLVGKYPISDAGADGVVKEKNDNAASRLVAKLVLDDREGTFFGRGFPRVPSTTLLPPHDPFGDRLTLIVNDALAAPRSTKRA